VIVIIVLSLVVIKIVKRGKSWPSPNTCKP